ncbi:type 1 fimbrial protein [Pseudomonas sp. B2M1-30]|uniref:type 1 fimbrial protein n=1 Tax=Pseudomonas TaxID=286 RepID=UPI001C3CB956|nr:MULTISPECIES: type 1 fimbrial protein [Pseudomonas]MBV4473565.1 type 1 fimbrial protein [Pseudomonas botevensis]MCU0117702.1 type 1 fimbrial protein [Pseudomonas sp. B2M1-30]MCU7259238.1 type 1 fimbrial protein [Pseudomonas koreensis]
MRIQHLPVVTGLLFALNNACWAAPPATQGVIRFQGAIVEAPCNTDRVMHSRFDLTRCPAAARAMTVEANSVDPLKIASPVTVQRLSDIDNGRFHDQQYQLVDEEGAPLRSGNYLITMSLL